MSKQKNNRPGLTPEIIESEKRKGLSQAEIARKYGVTRQAISDIKRRFPDAFSTTPREDVLKHFPWLVPGSKDKPMTQQKPYRYLRDHGEYMATGGKGMSEEKLKRLRIFYKKLRDNNVVVEFDPTLPPEIGVAPHGGFAYRPRLASDGDLIIRVNQYTTLTEEGHSIWTFPPVEP